jgi:aminoglycoside phosphotransferase (APT) family kinase protein
MAAFPSAPRPDPRQQPSDAFIAELQRRYPTEPEIDRVLTRKMRQRSGLPHQPVALAQLKEATQTLLGRELDKPFTLANFRWITGGSSKLMAGFDLDWHGMSGDEPRHVTPMVLRMSPAESIVESSRRREFEMIRALSGLIPVPETYWEDEDAEIFPYPALVFGMVEGAAKPSTDNSQQVTGLGINYGTRLRAAVTQGFMDGVARFHTADVAAMDLPSFEMPEAGRNAGILKQVAMWRRIWDEDRGEEEPLFTLTANWLEDNAPAIDHVSVIHGDCRSGNFLIDESDGRITAWLDWELTVLGDRHQDLTWATSLAYAHAAEDGKTLLVNGMLPIDEFYAAYEAASGLPVDPVRIRYYRVYNAWVAAIVCMATGYRAARGGKSHQDVVLTWLNGIGGMLMAQLAHALGEAMDAKRSAG